MNLNTTTIYSTINSAITTTVSLHDNNNNITLRNLTAYDMLQERINILEIFNLVDTSELDKYKLCYNIERHKN